MKFTSKLMLLLIICIGLFSCKKNPVGPDDSNAVPGRRDYTWVADTINNPFLDFYNIWGNSTTNIWTAGVLMSDALYKYDGQKWNLDNRTYISDPVALWGYGDNLWIGNDKGCIWKFTGPSYIQELKDFKFNDVYMDFFEMTGASNNEIYAVGSNHINPIIMKYDGDTWHLDKTLTDTAAFNQIKYCYRNDKYYLVSALNNYTTKIYEYDRKELKLIYNYPPSNAGPAISEIDGYAYIIIDNKIYRYFNGNMEFIFEVDDPNFGGAVWGRNRNDIFVRMQDGLAHYNGTNWQYLFKSPEPIWLTVNCAIFNNEVFIPAKIQRTGYPIIYHGTLK
jgi:hypothetical protein